jgi:hypothetical protein
MGLGFDSPHRLNGMPTTATATIPTAKSVTGELVSALCCQDRPVVAPSGDGS